MKEEREIQKQEEEKLREAEKKLRGIKEPDMFSRKMTRIVKTKSAAVKSWKKKPDQEQRRNSCPPVPEEPKAEREAAEEVVDSEKKAVMEMIIAELKDPNRDCNNFDPGKHLISIQAETVDSSPIV